MKCLNYKPCRVVVALWSFIVQNHASFSLIFHMYSNYNYNYNYNIHSVVMSFAHVDAFGFIYALLEICPRFPAFGYICPFGDMSPIPLCLGLSVHFIMTSLFLYHQLAKKNR